MHGGSVDGRLGKLLTRSRVDEAKDVVAANRKRSPVRAIRKAPQARVLQRQRVPNLGVGPGIEEEDPTATSLHGQRLPVGTDGDSPEHVAGTVHDPDGSGTAPEGREQVAAGLRRVVDGDRLAGEQKRQVEVLLDERLGAEALDELGRLCSSGFTALDGGEDAAGDGRGKQNRDPDEQAAQAAVGAPDASGLLLRCLAALRDELALELDGEVEGYALYRIKSDWEHGLPNGRLRVLEASATSSVATRELWRFLFGIDLVAHVESETLDPGAALFLMVADPRRLQLRLSDGIWLRILDAETALRARSYACDDAVVLELRDALCPWNAGRWRVGSEVDRTAEEPELELDVASLASAYLGGFDFHQLAAAERVRELRPGALERASALFRTSRPPYCPEEF